MNETLETQETNESTQTTEVTPPPVVAPDPWSDLTLDEKLERESAYRQMRDIKTMPPAPPPVRKARTDDELDDMDIPSVYRAAKDDAREEIMDEMEKKYGPIFQDLYDTAGVVAMNTLLEGLDPEAAKILKEQLKGEPASTIKRISQEPKVVKLMRQSAQFEASKNPKVEAPGSDRGMAGGMSANGITSQEVQERIAHMKRYGIDITKEEAIEDLKEIKGGA